MPRRCGRQFLRQQDVGGAVPLHDPVWHHLFGGALGPHLLLGLAEGEGLGLGEDVRRQDVVVVAERVEAWPNPMRSIGISLVPWWMSW